MWALITLVVLTIFGLGIVAAKHGENQGKYNFWATLFATILKWWLLYMAGLFDNYID